MPRTALTLGFVTPMLPTLVDEAPAGSEWVHEIKYDGYRTQLVIDSHGPRAFTRNGFDWTEKYGPVVASARALRCKSAIIDGEMCVQNTKGVTDFGELRRSIRSAPGRLVLFAFDLLYLNGRDLRASPLDDRRKRLHDLIGNDPAARIHFSEGHAGRGAAFFKAADAHGLEGIVSKRADSRYVTGRTKAWLKVKSFAIGDFAVLGVERSATGIPVALLATAGKSPTYVGDAMVTLKDGDREAFWASVERLGAPRSRLKGELAKRKAAWIKEGLFARVRHLKGEEKLRHATVQSVGSRPARKNGDVEPRHADDE